MALGFPKCSGLATNTIEALLGHSERPLPLSSLLALLVREAAATGLSNATGFVGRWLCSFPSFLGAVLGNCYGQWLGERPALGRCRTTDLRDRWAWHLWLAGSAGHRQRPCCCCLSSPTTSAIRPAAMARHRT